MTYRIIDSDLFKQSSINPSMKLLLAEIYHWSRYYAQTGSSYSYNPVKISFDTGLSIYETVELIDVLVKKGIIQVSEGKFRIFFRMPTLDMKTIIEKLKD